MNIDLHIHSYASGYKDDDGIVAESTVENAEVLMQKLNEYHIGLFSITDHNIFSTELYQRFDSLITSGIYPEVHGLLAGVEFDVKLEDEMNKCHIITIFDAKNRPENYRKIEDTININPLKRKEDFYSQNAFESLLKDIGLNVILIACQRSGLDRHEGHHNSLSESTMNAEKLIKIGYIDALEFQKYHVEGILLANLHKMKTRTTMVTGSDCHEWTAYPNHDHTQHKEFRPTRANILPTFKGLLMAVTSPETRINTQESHNSTYIRSFTVNGHEHKLANGINAIIGENGSGKSTILNMLAQNVNETFMKNLIVDNGMTADFTHSSDSVLYIKQGDIVKKFQDNALIFGDKYTPIDTSEFDEAYKKFASELMQYIKGKINAKELTDKLKSCTLEYEGSSDIANYFISIDMPANYSSVDNEHGQHYSELQNIIRTIKKMTCDRYYKNYAEVLAQTLSLLENICKEVRAKYIAVRTEQHVKNFIVSLVGDYRRKIGELSNSIDKVMEDIRRRKSEFISLIVDTVCANVSENIFPEPPGIFSGKSISPANGFNFNLEAPFHNRDVLPEFLSKMFNKPYATTEALMTIDTEEQLNEAVKGCGKKNPQRQKYDDNLLAFLSDMHEHKQYIIDTSSSNTELGDTLGELSLAYIKYTVQSADQSVIIIDQPEDHISNSNIRKNLISYLNSIRNSKQVIIVTHNPLLVVNLDVDRVFYVSKKGNLIDVSGESLEYETDTISVLDIVAHNMDGGRDSIERRLKVYGKEDINQDA